jgi:hypothetical protein
MNVLDDETEELRGCDVCGVSTLLEDIHHHGDDFELCAKCSGEWVAEVNACSHEWDRRQSRDDWGCIGISCRRCGVFFDEDWAMSWFPLICDGYVEVPGTDA